MHYEKLQVVFVGIHCLLSISGENCFTDSSLLFFFSLNKKIGSKTAEDVWAFDHIIVQRIRIGTRNSGR